MFLIFFFLCHIQESFNIIIAFTVFSFSGNDSVRGHFPSKICSACFIQMLLKTNIIALFCYFTRDYAETEANTF